MTERDPEAQGSEVAADDRGPGEPAGALAGTLLLLFATSGGWSAARTSAARKVRWMLGLLRPYRVRVLADDGRARDRDRGRAGSSLPRRARRSTRGSRRATRRADLIVGVFIASALVYGRRPTRRPTWSAGSGSGRCRTCASGSTPTCRGCRSGSSPGNRPGVLISRLTNDVQALDKLVTDGVVTLFSSTLTLLGVIVILLALDLRWRWSPS